MCVHRFPNLTLPVCIQDLCCTVNTMTGRIRKFQTKLFKTEISKDRKKARYCVLVI